MSEENVINIQKHIIKRLRKEIQAKDEKYCEHCGETTDDCSGYKCWI